MKPGDRSREKTCCGAVGTLRSTMITRDGTVALPFAASTA
jgi:hypothetical protein